MVGVLPTFREVASLNNSFKRGRGKGYAICEFFDELGVGVWVHGGKPNGALLLLNFLLFRTRYVRYFMAFGVCVS